MKNIDRATVRAVYDAAIAAGAKDNGPCAPREHYAPNYYGGVCLPYILRWFSLLMCSQFVLDPVGNNLECVCHLPESEDNK
jgi:hypothetical protein